MHRRSRFPFLLALAAVIAALTPSLSPGDAGQRNAGSPDCSGPYPPRFCKFTSLILYTQEKGEPFRGKIIRAGADACDRHRKVKVFRYPHHLAAKTRTDERGHWFIRRPNAHGNFYAKIVPAWRRSSGGNHLYFCEGDYSRTHKFG